MICQPDSLARVEVAPLPATGKPKTDFLATTPAGGYNANSPAGSATITSYRNLSVDITANMVRPGWLVLSDVNCPGWHVQTDGREEPIYTAGYIVRAVPLSAWTHTVRFYFLQIVVLVARLVAWHYSLR